MNRIPALFLAATLAGCDGAPVETQALGLEAVPEEVQGVQEGVSVELKATLNAAKACGVPVQNELPSGAVVLDGVFLAPDCVVYSLNENLVGCASSQDLGVVGNDGSLWTSLEKLPAITEAFRAEACPVH